MTKAFSHSLHQWCENVSTLLCQPHNLQLIHVPFAKTFIQISFSGVIFFMSFQIHRRGRALRKLAKQLTDGQVAMSPRSLQDYIMPYAMTALLDDKMLKVDRLAPVLQICLWFSLVLSSLVTLFPFSSLLSLQHSAARGHDISISGGGGRCMPPLDLVQVSLLP